MQLLTQKNTHTHTTGDALRLLPLPSPVLPPRPEALGVGGSCAASRACTRARPFFQRVHGERRASAGGLGALPWPDACFPLAQTLCCDARFLRITVVRPPYSPQAWCACAQVTCRFSSLVMGRSTTEFRLPTVTFNFLPECRVMGGCVSASPTCTGMTANPVS